MTALSGWIEVICGPMFSGKSEELIRRLRRAESQKLRVQVFKPALDTRYSNDEIVTHSGIRLPAEPVTTACGLLGKAAPDTEVVGIDEAHFFGAALAGVADQLANHGKRVLIAGLDTDFMGRPFPPLPELLSTAEFISKTLAVCACCGEPAKHTQRLHASQDLLLVGASDIYQPRCRRCFQWPDETSSGV